MILEKGTRAAWGKGVLLGGSSILGKDEAGFFFFFFRSCITRAVMWRGDPQGRAELRKCWGAAGDRGATEVGLGSGVGGAPWIPSSQPLSVGRGGGTSSRCSGIGGGRGGQGGEAGLSSITRKTPVGKGKSE